MIRAGKTIDPHLGTGGTMKTAARLATIELSDHLGHTAPLGCHWQEKPVVLVFIRHFG